MKKFASFVGVMALSFAGVAFAGPGWSGVVKLMSIEASEVNSLGVWASFNAAPHSGMNCQLKAQYKLGGSQTNIDKMMVLANQAMQSSRYVKAHWAGACSGGGTLGYPVLTGLTLMSY